MKSQHNNLAYPNHFAFTSSETLQEPKRVNILKRIAVGATALSLVVFGAHTLRKDLDLPKASEHSTAYLDNDEMETGIIVKTNDTPEAIAETVNSGRLHGQVLIDVENFIRSQGSVLESDSKQHELGVGDTIRVPIIPDDELDGSGR